MDVTALDWADALELDSLGMVAEAGRAVEALEAGVAGGAAVELPFPPEAVRAVAVCGMGGSAIAGDIVASVYRERLRRPVVTLRDYALPGWVGDDTLVVLMSYSGRTEETLTAAMQAVERGCLVVGVTSGGKLESFYGAQGVPIVRVPPGLQPRAAFYHLLGPLLVVLARLGVVPDVDGDLADARDVLARGVAAYGPGAPAGENPARQLAAALEGAVPLVYGAETTSAVARRWKAQINENAKAPAFWAELPELDHNEIVGFEKPGAFGARAHVVMLRDPHHHRQVQRRFELTGELVEARVRGVASVTGEGGTALGRALDLVLLGDHVSVYMGLLRGVDPGPVTLIEELKGRLATTGYGRGPDPRG
ncbi:MAG: bifunctional phosphoglucose/phosphomannose isomerase [Actinomycetota bacterium]